MQYCLGSNWASPREDGTEPLSRLQEKEFLEIEIGSMDQHQLDQWKRSAQPWPEFLSEATVIEAQKVLLFFRIISYNTIG